MKKILFILLTIVVLGGCAAQQQTSSTANEPIQPEQATAQSEQTNAAGPVKEITIDGSNWKWDQQSINVNKGDTVRLTVTSSDGTHGFGLNGYDVSLKPIGPGESKTIEFVADKEGAFDFYCNVPCGSGHMGMTGKFIVN